MDSPCFFFVSVVVSKLTLEDKLALLAAINSAFYFLTLFGGYSFWYFLVRFTKGIQISNCVKIHIIRFKIYSNNQLCFFFWTIFGLCLYYYILCCLYFLLFNIIISRVCFNWRFVENIEYSSRNSLCFLWSCLCFLFKNVVKCCQVLILILIS